VERQFPPIVMNFHPSYVNNHKGEAGQEPMQQIGTKDLRTICFQAVHPVIPTFFGQIVAYKYGQILIQCIHIGYKDTNIFSQLYRFRQFLYCFRFGFVGETS
jgi:hypothetical protein